MTTSTTLATTEHVRTKHEPETTQDNEQAAASLVFGIPHSDMLNFYDAESEHTRLASWLQQCPSSQTGTFLSVTEWCLLVEGPGGAVWVNRMIDFIHVGWRYIPFVLHT